MTGLVFVMLAVLAGTAVAAASLARIQRETEDLLDGYANALAEARERYRRELEVRVSASGGSTQPRAKNAARPDAAGPASSA